MHLPVLASDCSSCSGLCCVLLPFRSSDGFGITKQAGTPCPNLSSTPDTLDSCTIHRTLRADGWPGCTRYECFGAGQHLTQVTYGGSWRGQVDLDEMRAVLAVVQALHEMMLHLVTATRRAPDPVQGRLLAELVELDRLDPPSLLELDLAELHGRVGDVLAEASRRVRHPHPGPDLARADLAGQDLSGRDLRRGTLRGALLIRADLSGADLTGTDVLGADLRDADVRGALLADALFLTQPQVNGALGDAATTLAADLVRPSHWQT